MDSIAEAAQILTRVFESLARLNGKTLSAQTKADIGRACSLLAAGDGLEELLEDVPPRISPAEQAIDDPNFQRWRAARSSEGPK